LRHQRVLQLCVIAYIVHASVNKDLFEPFVSVFQIPYSHALAVC
jgi:hypothetical protein